MCEMVGRLDLHQRAINREVTCFSCAGHEGSRLVTCVFCAWWQMDIGELKAYLDMSLRIKNAVSEC